MPNFGLDRKKNAKNELTECASQLTGKHISTYIYVLFMFHDNTKFLEMTRKIFVIFLLFYCKKLFSKKVADYQFLFRKTNFFVHDAKFIIQKTL